MHEISWCNGASDKCGSVDTLDCNPAPALPPRQRCSPWQLSSGGSSGIITGFSTSGSSTSSSSSTTSSSSSSTISSTGSTSSSSSLDQVEVAAARARRIAVAAAPVVISPPNYPAPPRPPSRNGGDEARIARAGGSGRGASCCTLANGTPLPRVPPPRSAGAPAAVSTPAGWTLQQQQQQQQQQPGFFQQPPQTNSGPPSPKQQNQQPQQWASSGNHQHQVSPQHSQQIRIPQATPDALRLLSNSTSNSSSSSTATKPSSRHQQPLLAPPQQQQQQQQLEQQLISSNLLQLSFHSKQLSQPSTVQEQLQQIANPMSQNAASPPSRPPSSASSTASSSLGSLASLASLHAQLTQPPPRVHDHTRPLPPPRILPPPTPTMTMTSSSTGNSPSAGIPLSGSSFRSVSRAPLLSDSILSPQRLTTSLSSSVRTSPAANTTTSTAEVSLQSPRPDGERVTNEYIDTPFRPATNNRLLGGEECVDGSLKSSSPNPKKNSPSAKSERRPFGKNSTQQAAARVHRHQTQINHQRNVAMAAAAAAAAANNNHNHGRPITKQPMSFTKQPLTLAGAGGNVPSVTTVLRPGADNGEMSIVCDRCGKCRCKDCREPRSMPSRWLCGNQCLCSPETCLDYVSCVCCVKGCFYHCADGSLSGSAGASSGSIESIEECADEPCTCTGSRKAARWTCLGALSLILPCLLCYWPLRGCLHICETCYAKHTTVGCRCDRNQLFQSTTGSPLTTTTTPLSNLSTPADSSRDHPEKRLLGPDDRC